MHPVCPPLRPNKEMELPGLGASHLGDPVGSLAGASARSSFPVR